MTDVAEDLEAQIPTHEEVRAALGRVLASEGFVNSPRLKDFLTYIVEEALSGRGNDIKGKIVATDVYGKDLDEGGSALNLVRVEARRLRRGLDDYYSEAGRAETVRIGMQTGGYRPGFERIAQVAPTEPVARARPAAPASSSAARAPRPPLRLSRRSVLLAGGLAFILLAVAWVVGFRQTPRDAEIRPLADTATLSALRERSMSSVQATNLAEQTRTMFFPLFDVKRQIRTLDAFRQVIELDPGLASGYAGAAQVLALQSLLTQDDSTSSTLIAEALEMANQATGLDPKDGWAQAAHGWTLAVSGDMPGALRRARIAAKLSPEDGHVLDLIGITCLLANDVALMAEVSDPTRARTGRGRFANNNIWGAAQLILENYAEVIDAFSTAAERGHPVGAPSLFLLGTAYDMSGNPAAARAAIEELHNTWPGFPASAVATRFFASDPVTRDRVLATLRAYTPDK